MKNIRSWTLLSYVSLAVGLAACSTPADLVRGPTLEAQFGTSDEEVGVDVAITSSGGKVVLSQQKGIRFDSYYKIETAYTDFIWRRYDANSNLVHESNVSSRDCGYADTNNEKCEVFTPKALLVDKKGNSYSLYTIQYYYKYSKEYATHFYLDKIDAEGYFDDLYSLGYVYSTSSAPAIIDAAVDSSGNIYAAARVYNSGQTTNVVKKIAVDDTLVWQRASSVGTPYGVAVSSSGDVFVAGSSGLSRISSGGNLVWTKSGSSYNVGQSSKVITSTSNVYTRNLATIRKYDFTGKLLWTKSQTGLTGLQIQDVTADSSGNVYLSGKYDAGGSNTNAFTRKLNSSGTMLWTKTFGSSAFDDARGIATTTGSEIYITGETRGSLGPTNKGGSDGYVRRLNSSGNPVWTK